MYLTLNNSRLSVQILLSYKLFISFVISHHIDEYFDAFVTLNQTRNMDLFCIGLISELLVSFENAGNSRPSAY